MKIKNEDLIKNVDLILTSHSDLIQSVANALSKIKKASIYDIKLEINTAKDLDENYRYYIEYDYTLEPDGVDFITEETFMNAEDLINLIYYSNEEQ